MTPLLALDGVAEGPTFAGPPRAAALPLLLPFAGARSSASTCTQRNVVDLCGACREAAVPVGAAGSEVAPVNVLPTCPLCPMAVMLLSIPRYIARSKGFKATLVPCLYEAVQAIDAVRYEVDCTWTTTECEAEVTLFAPVPSLHDGGAVELLG